MSQLTAAMTEDELLTAITEAATYRGWRWHHVRRSDKALQMGHPGFPDLVLARKGRVLFFELKGPKGYVSDDQWQWMTTIGENCRIVWPTDLDEVLAELE